MRPMADCDRLETADDPPRSLPLCHDLLSLNERQQHRLPVLHTREQTPPALPRFRNIFALMAFLDGHEIGLGDRYPLARPRNAILAVRCRREEDLADI